MKSGTRTARWNRKKKRRRRQKNRQAGNAEAAKRKLPVEKRDKQKTENVRIWHC